MGMNVIASLDGETEVGLGQFFSPQAASPTHVGQASKTISMKWRENPNMGFGVYACSIGVGNLDWDECFHRAELERFQSLFKHCIGMDPATAVHKKEFCHSDTIFFQNKESMRPLSTMYTPISLESGDSDRHVILYGDFCRTPVPKSKIFTKSGVPAREKEKEEME
eukprot:TRINITY_DN2796_c0_g1_i2.p1 TRINITY_DN2796_c0_g1~~TRINITY_DN2796_c0_g1_i2.p1  ORF type:complete len:166 (-),score=39.03 TRINITY_DN2796_c0_g1_i2:84-581(-)